MTHGYDVIPAIGRLDQLERLLEHLGHLTGERSSPTGRTPVFLGGVCDAAGPTRSADLIRAMVDAGTALAVVGPSELQEVRRARPVTPHRPGAERSRDTGDVLAGNRGSTSASTGSAAASTATCDDWGSWLHTLPLWLELPGLRVAHGCWSEFDVAMLRSALDGNCLGTPALSDATSLAVGDLARAIDTIVLGPSVALPPSLWCRDPSGRDVRAARYRWWEDGPVTYRTRAALPDGCAFPDGVAAREALDTGIPGAVPVLFAHESPVVVGSRWCADGPVVLGPSVLALTVPSGHPVAYRWSGEHHLDLAHLVTL